MKAIRLILAYSCLLLLSCKSRRFQAPSHGMENTIMSGQSFYVTRTDKFERNDIAVFNYYGDDYSSPGEEPGTYKQHWEKRTYRLIAYSGDSVAIRDGEVFVNSRHVSLPSLAKMPYEIRSSVSIDEFDEDPSINFKQSYKDTIAYIAPLTRKQVEDYRKRKPAIISVRRKPAEQYLGDSDTIFAKPTAQAHWNQDIYGPLRIPSPGETIVVTSENYKLYKNIPGIQMGQNTIKEKLYFLLGDNRHYAADSRFIGLISHSNMYGIVK